MDEKLYDANHKRIGTRTKDAWGNDVIKDMNGRVVSRMGEDMLGNKVIRNSAGKTVGVYGQDMLGNDVIRDANGRVKARFGPDALGNDAVLDAAGRPIGYSEPVGGYSQNAYAQSGYGQSAYGQSAYGQSAGYVRPAPRGYPKSKLEIAFEKAQSRWYAPAIIAYLLPALYCAAAIFVKALPASPALMIGLLTAGIFLSSLCGRAAGMTGKGWQVGTFFISLLIYFVWFVVFTTYRTVWNVSEKEELITILAAPVLFLIAELIGGLIGAGINRSTRKRIFKLK